MKPLHAPQSMHSSAPRLLRRSIRRGAGSALSHPQCKGSPHAADQCTQTVRLCIPWALAPHLWTLACGPVYNYNCGRLRASDRLPDVTGERMDPNRHRHVVLFSQVRQLFLKGYFSVKLCLL